MTRMLFGTTPGAVAGFLTRPCCVLPAAVCLAGVSTIGLTHDTVTYRPAFLSVSALVLVAALWTTFRREGGLFNKILATSATLAGFILSLRMLEVF